ncbi:MAG: NAD(P)/FAD-dependent oxidoreductase [Bacteroidota bacterium]
MFDVIIVGGGAAGFYAAIHIAEHNPELSIAIFERGKNVLSKVKVSGGGRCNVTHALFSPHELVNNYPRGGKELLGPFHTHDPSDTMHFFEEKGVPLKVETDGRVFPKSDSSQTIVDCFLNTVKNLGINILKNSAVKKITFLRKERLWQVTTMNKHYHAKKLLIATGSNPKVWQLLATLGHVIVPPVPSLFTFNVDDKRIKNIQGISTHAEVEIPQKKHYDSQITITLKSKVVKEPVLFSEGPVLITHWGLSGPAILKLSAWGAHLLNKYKYNFKITVNWVPEYTKASMVQFLKKVREVEAKKTILRSHIVELPRRLWANLVKAAAIESDLRWAEAPNETLEQLAGELTACSLKVNGKSTFKEEFVTAGGVDLKEINFKTFESKILPNLYFAGEVINVDAITGGFNFQNAWTGAYIAAKAIASHS